MAPFFLSLTASDDFTGGRPKPGWASPSASLTGECVTLCPSIGSACRFHRSGPRHAGARQAKRRR